MMFCYLNYFPEVMNIPCFYFLLFHLITVFSEGSNIVFNYLLQKTNITPPTYIVLCQDDNASVYYKI